MSRQLANTLFLFLSLSGAAYAALIVQDGFLTFISIVFTLYVIATD